MISSDIKGAILQWLRFDRQFPYVATEVGAYQADCLGANSKMLIEVEVKVSLQDFRNDFKKPKHVRYREAAETGAPRGPWDHSPNAFYFAVPVELRDQVAPLLEDTRYGLITISTSVVDLSGYIPRVVIACSKPARKIHDVPPSAHILELIARRMSSELCSIYSGNYHVQNLITEFKRAGRAWTEPGTFAALEVPRMKNIPCQRCVGRPKEEGCFTCGGFRDVLVVIRCDHCGREGLSRPGAYTSYEGKKWFTVDGLEFVDHVKGRNCIHCEARLEGKKNEKK